MARLPFFLVYSLALIASVTLIVIAGSGLNSYLAPDTQTVTVDEHGECRKVTNNYGRNLFIPTKTALEWQRFRDNAGSLGVALDSCSTPVTISSNTNDYNLYNALGNPGQPVTVELTINNGVVVGSTSAGSPALTTGSLPAGSSVTIINNGRIQGKGGKGGNGGTAYAQVGESGQPGGSALEMMVPTTINNVNGQIWGGGGGGGGGAAMGDCYGHTPDGSGGGGGAGTQAGAGGTTAGDGARNGEPGTAMNGGAGGKHWQSCSQLPSYHGGDGGDGGGPGQTGGCGRGQYNSGCWAGGGAPGSAITTNGNSLTWAGSQGDVRGAVS